MVVVVVVVFNGENSTSSLHLHHLPTTTSFCCTTINNNLPSHTPFSPQAMSSPPHSIPLYLVNGVATVWDAQSIIPILSDSILKLTTFTHSCCDTPLCAQYLRFKSGDTAWCSPAKWIFGIAPDIDAGRDGIPCYSR